MRRPVGVKSILLAFCWTFFLPPSQPLSPCFHPHSRGAIVFRSVHVGRSRFSRCCHLIGDLSFHVRVKRGPGDKRSHRNSALGFCLFPSWNDFDLVCPFCFYAAAAMVMRLLLCNGSYTSPLTH